MMGKMMKVLEEEVEEEQMREMDVGQLAEWARKAMSKFEY